MFGYLAVGWRVAFFGVMEFEKREHAPGAIWHKKKSAALEYTGDISRAADYGVLSSLCLVERRGKQNRAALMMPPGFEQVFSVYQPSGLLST